LIIDSFAVGLNLTLSDRGLVSNILSVEGLLTQLNLEHGDDPCELKLVKTFFEGLILIKNRDVRDLVDLVKASDTVLYEFSELDCGLDCVGDTFNDNAVGVVLAEEIIGTLEVSADANLAFDTDFI